MPYFLHLGVDVDGLFEIIYNSEAGEELDAGTQRWV